jgi:predicted PurR-regulated permease PerM
MWWRSGPEANENAMSPQVPPPVGLRHGAALVVCAPRDAVAGILEGSAPFGMNGGRFRMSVPGLALVLAIQGALSATGLYLIGVPCALALGAWVSLTALLFLAVQQVEGNFLTPRIQGQTIKVPSVLVFLAVIVGGTLAGIMGVLFAVPTLAVLRVLFDFFRVRLRPE